MSLINKFIAWPFDLIRRASKYQDSPGFFGIFTDAGVLVGTAVPLLGSYLFYRNMRWPSGLVAAYIGGGVGNALLPNWVNEVTAPAPTAAELKAGFKRFSSEGAIGDSGNATPSYSVQGRLGSRVRIPNKTSPLGYSRLRPDEVYDRSVPVPRYPLGNSYHYALNAGTENSTWTRSRLHPTERF